MLEFDTLSISFSTMADDIPNGVDVPRSIVETSNIGASYEEGLLFRWAEAEGLERGKYMPSFNTLRNIIHLRSYQTGKPGFWFVTTQREEIEKIDRSHLTIPMYGMEERKIFGVTFDVKINPDTSCLQLDYFFQKY